LSLIKKNAKKIIKVSGLKQQFFSVKDLSYVLNQYLDNIGCSTKFK